MPFDHNAHYHDLLLREVPPSCRRALDVGCGTGEFARKLARRGIEVDAVDADGQVISTARELSSAPDSRGGVRFEQADITAVDLPPGRYDYVSCLACIHHVPFETVGRLRASLTDHGVLVILGCYREATPRDHLVSLAAVPVNAAARAAVFLREKWAGGHGGPAERPVPAPVKPPSMSLPEIRAESAALLPGRRIRRLLFWRYLLVFRNGPGGA